ncbi:MAG: hypothetical protein HY925_14835 [Elusimicrobia bacterium]|nr:hypothetical protein [Elusimicrobiota bacterium]
MSASSNSRLEKLRTKTPADALMAPKYISLGLALLTVLALWPALKVGFLFLDDHDNILSNPYVQQGLSWRAIGWAFTTFRGEIWNPLMWLSYMADFELFRLEPAGWHATSLVLHAASAAALFEALRRMTGRLWESALTAALFALHPTRVESVAWLAQRYDVLYGLFTALTLAAYGAWVRRPGPERYALLLAAYALALMSKGLAVVVPVLLLILDWWPLERLTLKTFAGRVREKLPLFALAGAAAWLVLSARRSLLASGAPVPALERISGVPVYYLAYLRNAFAPWLLPVCRQAGDALPLGLRLGSALAFGALSAAGWAWRRKAPWAWAGWLWFLVALAPVSGVAFPAGMTSRYLYLPLVGLAIAGVWGIASLVRGAEGHAALIGALLEDR